MRGSTPGAETTHTGCRPMGLWHVACMTGGSGRAFCPEVLAGEAKSCFATASKRASTKWSHEMPAPPRGVGRPFKLLPTWSALSRTSPPRWRAGFPEKEIFAMHLALEEAIVNANKHGHQGDWTLPLAVHYCVSADGVVAQVEDQGPGFAPAEVADPLAPENLERASGRGLLLMRSYMSDVCHNERGNCVCLCKRRLVPAARE